MTRHPTPADGLFYDVMCWVNALTAHFSTCVVCPQAREWRAFCLKAKRMLSFAAWRARQ